MKKDFSGGVVKYDASVKISGCPYFWPTTVVFYTPHRLFTNVAQGVTDASNNCYPDLIKIL